MRVTKTEHRHGGDGSKDWTEYRLIADNYSGTVSKFNWGVIFDFESVESRDWREVKNLAELFNKAAELMK